MSCRDGSILIVLKLLKGSWKEKGGERSSTTTIEEGDTEALAYPFRFFFFDQRAAAATFAAAFRSAALRFAARAVPPFRPHSAIFSGCALARAFPPLLRIRVAASIGVVQGYGTTLRSFLQLGID
jgi:hypothetical protein